MGNFDIIVKNLPSSYRMKEIQDFFSECGRVVDYEFVRSDDSINSGEILIVSFGSEAAFKRALNMNRTVLEGRDIIIESRNERQSDNYRNDRDNRDNRDSRDNRQPRSRDERDPNPRSYNRYERSRSRSRHNGDYRDRDSYRRDDRRGEYRSDRRDNNNNSTYNSQYDNRRQNNSRERIYGDDSRDRNSHRDQYSRRSLSYERRDRYRSPPRDRSGDYRNDSRDRYTQRDSSRRNDRDYHSSPRRDERSSYRRDERSSPRRNERSSPRREEPSSYRRNERSSPRREERSSNRDSDSRDETHQNVVERHVTHEYIDINKIIILQLPFRYKDQDLGELFKDYGKLEECRILLDKQTGKSRGMGIVRFEKEEFFTKAIEKMNGFELEGRILTVRKYLPFSKRFFVCSFISELLKVELRNKV